MSQLTLLRQRRFYPLFWTQFLGAFNDNFLKNSLVILITFKGTEVFGVPPAQMVSVAAGIFILPFFLFSATAGQLADKYEKGQIIRIVKLAEIAIMVLAAIGLLTEHFEFLLAVLFLMGLHSTFFGPLKYSILPQHLAENELIGGNALIEAGTFLAILIGTIVGGVLITTPTGPAAVSVGLIVVALLGYWVSRKVPEAPAVAPHLQVQWNPGPPTWEIIGYIKKSRPIFLSILGISWFWFFGGAFLSLFPPYCKDVLHADETVVTLFLACFSVGIALGSLFCERMSRRIIELGLVPLGSIGSSLFAADLAISGALPLAAPDSPAVTALGLLATRQGTHILVDLILLAVFSGFFIVPLYAFIQDRAEATHRSRVIAANNILNALFMVIASLMLVALMKLGVTIPQIFLVLAILNALVAIYIYSVLPEFVIRFCMWITANLMYRLKVRGEQNIPAKGAALLVCNHVSYVDWLILGAAIGRPLRFVMYYKFAQIPLIGGLMRQAKVIPIAGAKEDQKIMDAAFEKVAFELGDQELVCIFPEGQLTRDGKVGLFRPGVEKVLQQSPVPVIPVALHGLWGSRYSLSRKTMRATAGDPGRPANNASPSERRGFWPRVTVTIGAPIPPVQVTAAGLEERVRGMLGK